MRIIDNAIERRGGAAYRWELRVSGISADLIDVAANSGRHLIRVRKGLYAMATEHPEVKEAAEALLSTD